MVLTIELSNEEEAAFFIKDSKRDAVQQDSLSSVSTLTPRVVAAGKSQGEIEAS